MADNEKSESVFEEVDVASVVPSSSSGVVVISAPSDGVQRSAKQTTKVPKTKEEWAELEATHVARTGPPGYFFLQTIEKLEREALKDQEGREYSGDTDSDEEDKGGEDDEENEDDDEGSTLEESDEDEEPLTEEAKLEIHEAAAYPSRRLGPLPGTIGSEVYGSDTDGSDYDHEKQISVAEDNGSSTSSGSSSTETEDDEMNDIY
ncbi:hypothetical protein MMC27_005101 [Xylographa pallens]|nr:hypothetical protein [Xylographa pallens]